MMARSCNKFSSPNRLISGRTIGQILTLIFSACLILAPLTGISAKSIADLFPEDVNYYVLLRDYPTLKEEFPKSAYGKVLTSTQLAPMIEAMGEIDDSPHFALAVPAQFDRSGLFKLVEGDVALFSTHFGPIKDLPSDQIHADSIIAFEHNGRLDKVRDFLEEQARVNGEPHDEEKDSVGDWEIVRKHVHFSSETIVDVQVNPEWDYQNNPNAPYYLPISSIFEYDLVYEYAVGEKWALFAEGANEPLARVLRGLEKKGSTFEESRLGRSLADRFKQMGFDKKGPGVELYLSSSFMTAASTADATDDAQKAFIDSFTKNIPGFFIKYETKGGESKYALMAPYDESGIFAEIAKFLKPHQEKWFGIPSSQEGVFSFTSIDLEGLLRYAMAEMEGESEEFRKMRLQVQGGAMAATGMDLVEEIISRLGDGMVTARSNDLLPSDDQANESLPMEFALHLKDGSGLNDVLQQAYEKVLALQQGMEEVISVEELDGSRFYTINIPTYSEAGPSSSPFASLGIVNDWLVAGPTQSRALRFGKRANKLPEDGLLENRALRRQIRDLPQEAFFVTLASDEKVTHLDIGTALLSILAMVPSSGHWYAENPFTKPVTEAYYKVGEDETAQETFTLAAPYASFVRVQNGWMEGFTTIKPAE